MVPLYFSLQARISLNKSKEMFIKTDDVLKVGQFFHVNLQDIQREPNQMGINKPKGYGDDYQLYTSQKGTKSGDLNEATSVQESMGIKQSKEAMDDEFCVEQNSDSSPTQYLK